MAKSPFELVRRVGGGARTRYQVRTLGGKFKTYKGASYGEALELAEHNVPIEISEGVIDPEEYIEFERASHQLTNANEPLDAIELGSFSETTPLLGGAAAAGAVSGGGAAVSSVGATVGAGIGLTLGAAAISGIIGGLASKSNEDTHHDPVISIPGHHFIGPGNTISDIKPVDTDDHISKDHDIAYENAKSQKDIQDADKKSADEFLSDVIENQNPHSVLGYIGLKAKEKVEGIIGVKYPPNLPISPAGMAPPKYPAHKDPSRHPEFPDSKSRQRYVWDAWNRVRQNHGLPRVDPPPRLNLGVTHRPPINSRTQVRPSSDSISYHDWKVSMGIRDAGPLIAGFNKQVDDHNAKIFESVVADEISHDEQMEIEDIIRQAEGGGSISIADFDDRDGAGPSNAQQEPPPSSSQDIEMANPSQKRPATDQGGREAGPSSSVSGTTTATAANGTGHNSGSDGGLDSTQGPLSTFMKGGYNVKSGMLEFTKCHDMVTFAIPYKNVTTTHNGGSNLVITPLTYVPVERLFFYLSPDEAKLIPAGSRVHSVDVTVHQLTCSTSYPTGGTVSTVATMGHPKVLLVGHDLPKKSRGGVNRNVQLAGTMIPSIVAASAPEAKMYDEFIKYQYGTDQSAKDADVIIPGCISGIPFVNQCQFCIYQPSFAKAKALNYFDEDEAGVITNNVSPGFEVFTNMIDRINANDTTWAPVAQYHYEFVNAPIGDTYPAFEIHQNDFFQTVGNAQYYNCFRNVTELTPGGDLDFREDFQPSTRSTVPIINYKSSPMEQGAHYVRGDAAGKPARQPQLHIGVQAIPKFDPALNTSRRTTFVQATIQFQIRAHIKIQLPSYPNRFILPKQFTTNIENAAMGVGAYPVGTDGVVTFGLLDSTGTAPARSAIDQRGNEETEDGMVLRYKRDGRSLPRVPDMKKKMKKSAASDTAPVDDLE